MGENIAQAFQFVYTKNAEAGFVARSMLDRPVLDKPLLNKPGSETGAAYQGGCVWDVPAGLHSPVRQKMVLMNRAKDKAAARAFLQYMRSERAREIIKSSGYDVSP
jgi:molybdate transport system substrate-binding protein